MRIIFMGTPDFALPTLTELIAHDLSPITVYTQPPRPAGRRNLQPTPSPVAQKAKSFGIPIHTPLTLRNEEEIERLQSLAPDLIIVVAYGLILPRKVLDIPPLGCLNLHASLLPRWRGAAPIQRAIMAGDKETGVMIMRMEEGLDTGPIGLIDLLPLTPEMTSADVTPILAQRGADLLIRAVAAISRNSLTFHPQDEANITYAHKITKQEARIDWEMDAPTLLHKIHGLSPFPGAYFETDLGHGVERIKILRGRALLEIPPTLPGTFTRNINDNPIINCKTGAIELLQVQRPGRTPVSGQEFLNGIRWQEGHKL